MHNLLIMGDSNHFGWGDSGFTASMRLIDFKENSQGRIEFDLDDLSHLKALHWWIDIILTRSNANAVDKWEFFFEMFPSLSSEDVSYRKVSRNIPECVLELCANLQIKHSFRSPLEKMGLEDLVRLVSQVEKKRQMEQNLK